MSQKTDVLAIFLLACSHKEVRLGRESNHYMDNEMQVLSSKIWLSGPTAIWVSEFIFIVTFCLAVRKNPPSLTGT